jgi:hypothetical protein
MKKAEFDKLEAMLYKRGYHKYIQHWYHEDYVISKGFHKSDNQWDDDRYAYQILLSIYDYSDKNYMQLTEKERDHVGIDIRFGVSRNIEERIDMVMSWHDNTTIEEVEAQAESFYKWVCETWNEPREYE